MTRCIKRLFPLLAALVLGVSTAHAKLIAPGLPTAPAIAQDALQNPPAELPQDQSADPQPPPLVYVPESCVIAETPPLPGDILLARDTFGRIWYMRVECEEVHNGEFCYALSPLGLCAEGTAEDRYKARMQDVNNLAADGSIMDRGASFILGSAVEVAYQSEKAGDSKETTQVWGAIQTGGVTTFADLTSILFSRLLGGQIMSSLFPVSVVAGTGVLSGQTANTQALQTELQALQSTYSKVHEQLQNGLDLAAKVEASGGVPNPHGLGYEINNTLPEQLRMLEQRMSEISNQINKLR